MYQEEDVGCEASHAPRENIKMMTGVDMEKGGKITRENGLTSCTRVIILTSQRGTC
jgi:hypothetical protein